MTSRAVVILTEPEQCELAGPDALVQAMLEVQQLSKAGLAASQAFCDHPAAAMKFIEAYTKAYPELQLRSSDLPPPEQLYSIVADGRVMPLRAPTALEGAKPGEASQLYPLYVLSFGAPDALMRALQHNSFAKSDIQVVEIAPVERLDTESVSVADAVAHDRRSSWLAETSAEREPEDDDAFPSAELGARDSLKLDSIEVDLDRIQLDRIDGQDHYDRTSNEPASAVVVTPPVSGTAGDPGGSPPTSNAGVSLPASNAGVSDGGITTSDPATPNALVTEAAPGPSATLPTPSASVTGPSVPATSLLPDTTVAAPAAGEGEVPEPVAGDSVERPRASESDAESPERASDDVDPPEDPAAVAEAADPGDGGGDAPDAAPSEVESPLGPTPARLATPEAATPSPEDRGGTNGQSFSDPRGDVSYPPNTSFAMDDDVSYPLPIGSGLDGLLDDFFGGSGGGEVVDLEAMFADLSEPLGASTAAFDVRLMGARGEGRRGADDVAGPGGAPEPPVPPYTDRSEPDRDDAGHERLPVGHDLDI
jgi:hypothetical protein